MSHLTDEAKIVLAAFGTVALVVGLGVAGANYMDTQTCRETAELFGDTNWKYSMRLGCMIEHKGRWVSGESLRNNTINMENAK